jgi:hypothetical protein
VKENRRGPGLAEGDDLVRSGAVLPPHPVRQVPVWVRDGPAETLEPPRFDQGRQFLPEMSLHGDQLQAVVGGSGHVRGGRVTAAQGEPPDPVGRGDGAAAGLALGGARVRFRVTRRTAV